MFRFSAGKKYLIFYFALSFTSVFTQVPEKNEIEETADTVESKLSKSDKETPVKELRFFLGSGESIFTTTNNETFPGHSGGAGFHMMSDFFYKYEYLAARLAGTFGSMGNLSTISGADTTTFSDVKGKGYSWTLDTRIGGVREFKEPHAGRYFVFLGYRLFDSVYKTETTNTETATQYRIKGNALQLGIERQDILTTWRNITFSINTSLFITAAGDNMYAYRSFDESFRNGSLFGIGYEGGIFLYWPSQKRGIHFMLRDDEMNFKGDKYGFLVGNHSFLVGIQQNL